jgi:hypothetical protein
MVVLERSGSMLDLRRLQLINKYWTALTSAGLDMLASPFYKSSQSKKCEPLMYVFSHCIPVPDRKTLPEGRKKAAGLQNITISSRVRPAPTQPMISRQQQQQSFPPLAISFICSSISHTE